MHRVSLAVSWQTSKKCLVRLQSGHLTHEQYDLVYKALESRVEALEEFVRGWDRYVPEKEVDDMPACLKDYKEKRGMTIAALTNYMHQSKRSAHGDLGVLARGVLTAETMVKVVGTVAWHRMMGCKVQVQAQPPTQPLL